MLVITNYNGITGSKSSLSLMEWYSEDDWRWYNTLTEKTNEQYQVMTVSSNILKGPSVW